MTQAAGKTYLPFVAGLEDAWRTRIITHASGDWAADQFWMTAYYSFGAWSGLLLMRAPRPAAAPGYAELAAGKEGLV